MLKAVWFIFYTELLLLWRHTHEWLYPLSFFIIVISLFPLAFTPDPEFLQKYIPGCIWIAALLASLLSVENIFFSDLEEGSLEQLLLSPLPLPLLILAKIFAQWIITALPLILLTPILGLMFHLSFFTVVIVSISLLMGTPILILVGSLSVALTLGVRQQGALLGLLILPLVTPVLIFGVNIASQAQIGFAVGGSLAFLAGICIFAITLLPWVIAGTLRVSMD
jgi:heme exporter protein B